MDGRLPPEDGSDWRENLGKRVSDDFATLIFRGETFFGGEGIFSKTSKILRGRLPPEDGSDWRENPPHPAEGRCLACEIVFGSRRTRLIGFATSPSHCQGHVMHGDFR